MRCQVRCHGRCRMAVMILGTAGEVEDLEKWILSDRVTDPKWKDPILNQLFWGIESLKASFGAGIIAMRLMRELAQASIMKAVIWQSQCSLRTNVEGNRNHSGQRTRCLVSDFMTLNTLIYIYIHDCYILIVSKFRGSNRYYHWSQTWMIGKCTGNRKPLYLMIKTMVSHRFSLQQIHWIGFNHKTHQHLVGLLGHLRRLWATSMAVCLGFGGFSHDWSIKHWGLWDIRTIKILRICSGDVTTGNWWG